MISVPYFLQYKGHLDKKSNREAEGTVLNYFFKPSITLISKPGKDKTKTESCRPVSLMNIDSECFLKDGKKYPVWPEITLTWCHGALGGQNKPEVTLSPVQLDLGKQTTP